MTSAAAVGSTSLVSLLEAHGQSLYEGDECCAPALEDACDCGWVSVASEPYSAHLAGVVRRSLARSLYLGSDPWDSLAPSFRASLIGQAEDMLDGRTS